MKTTTDTAESRDNENETNDRAKTKMEKDEEKT